MTQSSQLTIKNKKQSKDILELLQRQGIRGLDPKSPEGKYIEYLFNTYLQGINTNLPPAYVEMLVEMMIMAVMAQRSSFEFILQEKAPSKELTEEGRAQRQAWQMAVASWRGFCDTIIKCTKELRPAEAGPKKP